MQTTDLTTSDENWGASAPPAVRRLASEPFAGDSTHHVSVDGR
jgi:hypothetical protein